LRDVEGQADVLLAAGEDYRGVLVDGGRRLGVGEEFVRPSTATR
jgi:hypothetical protein